ncbi:hypothetical protein [Pseudoruegeria sp. HB172150]|uniref:hypothetical protein n=1 Tax=Pseudoruegeria sp. HB172150 TaxID=2721164 RepID=UPI0020A69CAA|nr:hypothetical protein [Pseudoruegeria sp. HB172150]
MTFKWLKKTWDTAVELTLAGQNWARHRLPPGTRLPVGLLLMAGGMVGFLPILGFWMLPLGVAVASLDVVPAYRWVTGGFRRQ